ncbi:hypothetical protein ACJRW5_02020 [Pseudomonas sp. SH1-B]
MFDHNPTNGLRPVPHYKASSQQNAGRRGKLTTGKDGNGFAASLGGAANELPRQLRKSFYCRSLARSEIVPGNFLSPIRQKYRRQLIGGNASALNK